MEKKGDGERQGEKRELPPQEQSQLATPGPRERVAADASPQDRHEVIVEVPLGHDEGIQDPHVEVLEALVGQVRLMAGHPAEGAKVDVVIQTFDIGIAVMEDVVLPSPDVGTGAEQV